MVSTTRLLCILMITIGLLFILLSPTFRVKNVTISGNKSFSEEEVKNLVGLGKNTNIFQFMLNNMGNSGDSLSHYIDRLNVIIQLPNSVKINIEERNVIGYVPYSGAYLCIDGRGRAVDSTLFIERQVPIILGVGFDDFQLGQVLKAHNQGTYDSLVKLASFLVKYELLGKIIKIDMSNIENIRLYTNETEVLLGGIENLNDKVNSLAAIIKQQKDLKGILDISDLKRPIVLKKT